MRADRSAGHPMLVQHYDATSNLSDVAGPPAPPSHVRYIGPPVKTPPTVTPPGHVRYLGPPVSF
jgi:hypothetical protein